MKEHTWQYARFTGTKSCEVCGLVPIDSDDMELPCSQRATIEKEYEINDRGIITSPGKFEGEKIFAPALWETILDGLGKTHYLEGDEFEIDYVFVADHWREEFPEIGDDIHVIVVNESENGFIHCEELTNEHWKMLVDQ